ncbi:MAG: hypothetical protein A2086_10440 [Spirochaetes bacterium GWD1_27_9]|nr:MAG: hypothetical protein A2Z98_16215 [Spirochaetes bacterium GWB1_27_13]OHD22907.1 MAG: hypothetical protein A2Y34_00715 [Spirochaetes bacterium GWC1_27_15]OHD43144.1 MAG: hypothetical protein A2086_10440 [Spirochaetes bacterium GWD1_27_9]
MKVKIIFLFVFITTLVFGESAIDFFNKGKESFFYEKYEDAIFYFKKALEINPNYIEPNLELARLYFDIENYDYSYNYITKALKLAPLNDELIIFSADIDTKLKKYDIAEKKYKNILNKNPLNIKAYNGLANLYLLTERKILAKKSLEEILKSEPTNFTAISLLARYYEPLDKAKSEKYYVMNVENNSLNPESYFLYSVFCFKNNNISKAIDNVNIAIKIKDTLKYQKYYGKYTLFLNQGDLALKIFKELLQKSDINYLNYYHLGYAYYLISDFNNAKTALTKSLGLREDDEVTSYFLNQILINKFNVDDETRKLRSESYYKKALKAKQESYFDLYIFNLKESIRIYPKNVLARLELAEYYKSQNLNERYIKELKIALKYTDDVNLKDKLEIEQNLISYRLGDDWGIEQYDIKEDSFNIPLFVVTEINNLHYNFGKIYGRVLVAGSYEKQKFEFTIMDEKEYSTPEKMQAAKEKKSPFYMDLYVKDMANSIDVVLQLKNAGNNSTIKEYKTFQIGNDRLILSANTLLRRIDTDMPFKAHIIKISNDKALINAGRRAGINLKDNFLIITNQSYNIEMARPNFIYNNEDIKGYGMIVKLDENIAELKFKDNDYFKDIDVDDIIIYKK